MRKDRKNLDRKVGGIIGPGIPTGKKIERKKKKERKGKYAGNERA